MATDLGIDPIDIRLRNLIEPYSLSVNYMRVTTCGLRECIELVESASGWRQKHGRLRYGRGVGFALSAYMCGAALPIYFNDMSQSEVQIKVDRGGGVTVYSMVTDIGQGSHNMLATVVAEVLGLRPRDIALVVSDTDLTPIDLGSYSSRVTFMAGNAAVQAAERMRDKVFAAVSADLGVAPNGCSRATAACSTATIRAWGWIGKPRSRSPQRSSHRSSPRARTRRRSLPGRTRAGVGPSPAYSYTASVVELECDPETGVVDVDRVWIAHDIGKPVNRVAVEGQVVGSVYMALGEALFEEQTFRRGYLKNPGRSSSTAARRSSRCRRLSRCSASRPTMPRARSAPRRLGRGRCCR